MEAEKLNKRDIQEIHGGTTVLKRKKKGKVFI